MTNKLLFYKLPFYILPFFFLAPMLCMGMFLSPVYSNPLSDWIPLATDSKNEIKQKIKTEVEKREDFSTSDEESINIKGVEGEREREDSAYKDTITSLTAEFNRYKKERDGLTVQFQNSSTDFEGLQKNIKNIKSTIENYDNDIARFEQDIKTQKESFTKWLKTEKQGEAVVVVIYTHGFKDIAHDLEKQADQISSPLMAEQMGTYVKSYTTVINSIVIEDFIQTITEGTAKWNGEEPYRIELKKESKGTVYLRIKRYELYPFQKPETGVIKGTSGSKNMKATLIQSLQDLESFLSKNGYSARSDLSRIENIIREANIANRQAEGLNELSGQIRSYEENISRLKAKITNAKDEKEIQINLLKKKEQPYEQMKADIETLRKKKEESEKLFNESQTRLSEKKRIRESIIIKTALVAPKGSQTPADASAEIIMDKLDEVKNDARTQHSSSTTTVVNYQLKEDTTTQAITEAKIIALKLLSFINEGDSVKVKMAFRVKTVLEETSAAEKAIPTQNIDTSKEVKSVETSKPIPSVERTEVMGGSVEKPQSIYRNPLTKEEKYVFYDLTVLDKETKLMWTRDANIADKEMNWNDAFNFIESLNQQKHGGYSDWRLPSADELLTLAKFAKDQGYNGYGKGKYINDYFNKIGFKNVEEDDYRASDIYFYDTKDVGMRYGYSGSTSKNYPCYVWPVRIGESPLPSGGRTEVNGSSGETPRTYIDPVTKEEKYVFYDLTVLDKETKLMWTRDANIAGKVMKEKEAHKFIKSLNQQKYGGYSDWRLPNKGEFLTLLNFVKKIGYTGHGRDIIEFYHKIGFKNIQSNNSYWLSITDDELASITFAINFHYWNPDLGLAAIFVWPVRRGQ